MRIMTDQSPIAAALRHDGWTPARRTRFLDHLAGQGSVRAACAHVGKSREAAYRLKRRDALFARGWDAALVLARAVSAEALASRAIDGVEEEIWYRGELVGTRRKYDSRLLLAHMARLDRIAERHGAEQDASRFDEILALVGDEPVPAGIDCDEDGMTMPRDDYMAMVSDDAEVDFDEAWAAEHPECDEDDDDGDDEDVDQTKLRESQDRMVESERAYRRALVDARWNAHVAAGVTWDAWRDQAHSAVDRILAASTSAEPVAPAETPGTLSELSTSPGDIPADGAAVASTGGLARPTWADYHAGRGPKPHD
jgi:hypothetical protein